MASQSVFNWYAFTIPCMSPIGHGCKEMLLMDISVSSTAVLPPCLGDNRRQGPAEKCTCPTETAKLTVCVCLFFLPAHVGCISKSLKLTVTLELKHLKKFT